MISHRHQYHLKYRMGIRAGDGWCRVLQELFVRNCTKTVDKNGCDPLCMVIYRQLDIGYSIAVGFNQGDSLGSHLREYCNRRTLWVYLYKDE
jgi:hypothetical protein